MKVATVIINPKIYSVIGLDEAGWSHCSEGKQLCVFSCLKEAADCLSRLQAHEPEMRLKVVRTLIDVVTRKKVKP